jgi:hypothetical protein
MLVLLLLLHNGHGAAPAPLQRNFAWLPASQSLSAQHALLSV